jgi:hypothetical protein
MILDDDVQVTPGYWNYGFVNCTTPNLIANLYNVTMNTDDKSTNQYGLGDAVEKTQVRLAKGRMFFRSVVSMHDLTLLYSQESSTPPPSSRLFRLFLRQPLGISVVKY